MTLRGENLIGAESRRGTEAAVRAVEAATGQSLEPDFPGASPADLDRACALAEAAFDPYRETDPETRAGFLEAIAANILAIGDDLVARCMAESGLPRPRIEGERARTAGQLRLFAGVVREGSTVEARIDPALPDRKPLPRPDLRLRRIPVGPVAVFGASNFPLAFSVAGGDTASALAAGCPVIVKAHPAHPGTSELVGRAIQAAVSSCGLPEGTFSLLFDAGQSIGQALVADPRIAAVGFTGSRRGGTALMAIAAGRPTPVPVYAEMSSINPVLLFPGALAERGPAIGRGLRGRADAGRRAVLHQSGPRPGAAGAGPRRLPGGGRGSPAGEPRRDHADPGHPARLSRGRRAPVRARGRHAPRRGAGRDGDAGPGDPVLHGFGRLPGGSGAAGGDVRRRGAGRSLPGLRGDARGARVSGGPAHGLAPPRPRRPCGRARPAAAPGAAGRADPGGRFSGPGSRWRTPWSMAARTRRLRTGARPRWAASPSTGSCAR